MKTTRAHPSLATLPGCALITLLALAGCGRPDAAAPSRFSAQTLPPGISIQVVPGIPPGVAAGLRPYESFAILINGAGLAGAPLGESIALAPASRRDGQPLPAAALADLQLNGVSDGGWRSFRIFPAFAPGQLLPRQPGTCRFDFILKSDTGTWSCPPVDVPVSATESETRLLAEFVQSGASQFLDHPLGARRAAGTNVPPLPYDALAAFAAQHPGTYLIDVIAARLRSLHLEDINSCGPYSPGPLLAADRQACAALLGRLDENFAASAMEVREDLLRSLATSEKPDQLQQQIAINEEWFRCATATTPAEKDAAP